MFELVAKLQEKLQLKIFTEGKICGLLWSGFYWDEERGYYWHRVPEENTTRETLEEICPRKV